MPYVNALKTFPNVSSRGGEHTSLLVRSEDGSPPDVTCCGRPFVTGFGAAPPRRPHDRRWLGRPHLTAWPGYFVGGGWPKATDWVDDEDNYRVNEIAINWTAPLVYALAGFLRGV